MKKHPTPICGLISSLAFLAAYGAPAGEPGPTAGSVFSTLLEDTRPDGRQPSSRVPGEFYGRLAAACSERLQRTVASLPRGSAAGLSLGGRPCRVMRSCERGLVHVKAAEGGEVMEPDMEWEFVYPVRMRPGGLRVFPRPEVVVKVRAGASAEEVAERHGLTVVRRLRGVADEFVLGCDPSKSPYAVCVEVDRDEQVVWVCPNHAEQRRLRSGPPTDSLLRSGPPADPLYSDQWHLKNTGQGGGTPGADVDAEEAWAIFRAADSSAEVVIAVIDTLMDMDHPDLDFWQNAAEVGGQPGVDDDQNGYVDDVSGWDFMGGDNDPDVGAEQASHGTAVAGVAAARAGNGVGGVGAAFGLPVLPVAVGTEQSFAADAALAEALRYAASHADVVNCSWGTPDLPAVIDSALDFATGPMAKRGDRRVMVLFASGNAADGGGGGGIPGGGFPVSYEISRFLGAGSHQIELRFESFGGAAAQGGITLYGGGVASLFGDDAAILDPANMPPTGVSFGGDVPFEQVDLGGEYAFSSGAVGAGETSSLTWSFQLTSTDDYFPYIFFEADTGANGRVRLFLDGAEVTDEDFFSGIAMPFTGSTDLGGGGGFPGGGGGSSALAGINLHPGVINIGACDENDVRSSYSQYGDRLEFVAPSNGSAQGLSITTTDVAGSAGYGAGDYTDTFGGTSSACPLAAGTFAYLMSYKSDITRDELLAACRAGADKIGGVTYDGDGRHPEYGYGRLNMHRGLLKVHEMDGGAYKRYVASYHDAAAFDSEDPRVAGPTVDADGDGQTNYMEFAFGSSPRDAGSFAVLQPRMAHSPATGAEHLLITVPVRSGVQFTAGESLSGAVDGVRYSVLGSRDLSTFDEGVVEVEPAATDGLPAPAAGYEYRSFRFVRGRDALGSGAIKAMVTPAP